MESKEIRFHKTVAEKLKLHFTPLKTQLIRHSKILELSENQLENGVSSYMN